MGEAHNQEAVSGFALNRGRFISPHLSLSLSLYLFLTPFVVLHSLALAVSLFSLSLFSLSPLLLSSISLSLSLSPLSLLSLPSSIYLLQINIIARWSGAILFEFLLQRRITEGLSEIAWG